MDCGVVRSGFRLPWEEEKAPLSRTPPAFRYPIKPGGHRPFTERSGRRGPRPQLPGLLREDFCSHESFRGLAHSSRPFPTEQLPASNKVQDGNAGICQGGSQARRLGHVYRPDRHLLPHTHPPIRPEVAEIQMGENIFQFRALPFGLSLAPWVFTMVTHQMYSLSQEARDSTQGLSRRLAYPPSGSSALRYTHPDRTPRNKRIRFLHKPSQVRVGP